VSDVRDFLTGIATAINTAGIGVYDPARTWTAADTATAVVFASMPPFPDRCIVLTAYTIDASPDQAYGSLRLQVRSRGLPGNVLDAADLDELTFKLLQGLQHQRFGAVDVNQILIYSSMPMGMDDSQRWEQSTNYAVDTSNPAAE